MKYTKRNRPILVKMLFLSLLIGTFAWDLFERLLSYAEMPVHIAIGPVGFDLLVISCYVYLNPGTLFGLVAAIVLFRRL